MIPEVLAEYEDDYNFFYDAAMRNIGPVDEDIFPEDVVSRILDGEHPIKVFRQFRRVSQDQLARELGMDVLHLQLMESGRTKPSRKTLADIARVLRVDKSDIS